MRDLTEIRAKAVPTEEMAQMLKMTVAGSGHLGPVTIATHRRVGDTAPAAVKATEKTVREVVEVWAEKAATAIVL